jgi:hypothetical protein
MSADVGDALLGFRLTSGLGLRGKREDSCLLPLTEPRQQHDLAIGELERVMIGAKRALVDQSRLRESAQGDKWSFCLTAGKIWPANQERA